MSLFYSLILSEEADAQAGNEWINMSQTYLKIPVARTGMYRITQATLASKGITGVNPKKFQLFHRGKEQALYVGGETDESFDTGDYIDFYGKKNDGSQDTQLYRDPNFHLNHHYSLYTDTTVYFLTWTLDNTLGKRTEQINEAIPAPAPTFEAYHSKKELVVFAERYSPGQNYPLGSSDIIYLSQFDTGEGWSSGILYGGTPTGATRVVSLPIANVYSTNPAPTAKLKISLAGASNTNSTNTFQIRVGTSAGNMTTLASNVATNFNYTQLLELDVPIASFAGGSNLLVEFKALIGNFVIAYVEVQYPQSPTLKPTESNILTLPMNPNNISYLELATPPANAKIYELQQNAIVREFASSVVAGKLYSAVIDMYTPRELLIDNGIRLTPINIESVAFQNINPALFDYLIITHHSLRKEAGGYPDIIQAYADYRASTQGGSYKPLTLIMEQLYNQFNYGEKTPLAIRRYIDWMLRNGQPKYLFIMGLGMGFPDSYSGSLNFRQNPSDFAQNLVPILGFPPSDIALVEKLNGSGGAGPSIAVGRIGVTSPQQVLNYFDKVKEHENVKNELWQKNIIHLVGGRTESEQAAFSGRMGIMKSKAEGVFLGGKVKTTNKRTTGITEIINMSEQINSGTSLINFFGHSNLTNTDLEIGFCSEDIQGYRNKGKYPLMLVNGCNLGGIFYGRPTLARDWLYTRDRGAIGFIGHTYYGYSNVLADYSTQLYQTMFGEANWVGKPIGDVLRYHINQNISLLSAPELSVGQQMLLQADPALVFFKANKPDYYTDDSQLYLKGFDNAPVTALSESFKLQVVVANLGIMGFTKIGVRIKHTYPDGSQYITELPAKYNPIAYQDTLVLTIAKQPNEEIYGNNTLEVFLDYENTIDEMRENNNVGILNFFMPTFGVFPTLPQEFSIVNEQPFSLTAVTSNGLSQGRDFIFELDTVKTFNSLYRKSSIVPAGVTGSWEIPSLLSNNDTDSTVYYWRVNYADAVNDPNILWGQSSFTYIKNSSEGWTQRHFSQFERNALNQIKRNDTERKWNFDEIKKRIKVRTFGSENGGNYAVDAYMLYEELPQVFAGRCGTDVIVCMAFDHLTGTPYRVFPNACGREPYLANNYNNSNLLNGALNDYLANVNANDFVLFFTIGNINFDLWTPSVKNAFVSIGGNPSIFNSLKTGHPYIILGRKGGAIGTAEEAVALNISTPKIEAIVMETALRIPYYTGTISSTQIGPSVSWKEFKQNVAKPYNTSNATYKVAIYGANLQGTESPTPLLNNITASSLNLSTINATSYPYLRLVYYTEDAVARKAPIQLRNWLVLYDGVPDGMMDVAAIGQSAYNITPKEEGLSFELEFAFRNLTGLTYASDSLTVQMTRKNLSTLAQEVKTFKIKAPLPKATVKFKHMLGTIGWGGKNELKVYVNPKLVPERYYENNVQIINFEVIPDKNNPLLEVAFDGKKILHGEIVSASPLISVQLRDDNRFVLANNPTNLQVAIKKPGVGQPFEAVDMNSNKVTWNYQAGRLMINIKRDNLESGIYTLKAQGTDGLGNLAATDPYQIDFEVVKESTVTNVLPYPNPFSTSTRFVFTLTGDQVPDEVKIQIMTVAGKVVREISHAELGNIRVGNNMSEYAWDGTDEYGEKLANGVYLYRVIMKKNGQMLEHRNTSADKAFKKGIGKLYIAR